jgi:hypothetical protein
MERGDFPDVYVYDQFPSALRVQIVQIIQDGLEPADEPDEKARDLYNQMHNALAREYGLFVLTDDAKGYSGDRRVALFNFFLREEDVERALDVVELTFRCITRVVPNLQYARPRRSRPDDSVEELNARFREHGIGYRFESNEIIRVDSEFLHSEIVRPVLGLLREGHYAGANDEFLRAHEHYRHGRNKEALNEALKALESTMKTICERRQWSYETSATSKRLLEICFAEGLMPSSLQAHFTAVRATLESGLPTIRNRTGGHGQGAEPVNVPKHLVSYGLNLAASAIKFLVEAENELPV